MKRMILGLVAIFAVLWALPEPGQAIPAFARKYGFNCNMCHVSFTKLNDFGQRYRNYGYQMPGQEGSEKNIFETAPPVSLRTMPGMQAAHSKELNTSGFNLYGFDLLSGGVMHKNISYLLIYTPRIDNPAKDFRGISGGASPSQEGSLEAANIVFSNLATGALNARIGRFEPAYVAVSAKRSYYIGQPYSIYSFETPSRFVIDENQMGAELTGHFRNGFLYGLGVVNGNGANPDNNKFKDVYLRVSQTVGRGEGQNAGQRIGLFGYMGWQPLSIPAESLVSPGGETAGIDNRSLSRYGGDVSLNYAPFNLTALFMQGIEDKRFNFLNPTKEYKYTGGFAQLDYYGLANNRILISALYNWVTPPSEYESQKFMAVSGLVRYYLGDWTAVNVALHLEYTHQQIGKDSPAKQDLVTALIDFAF